MCKFVKHKTVECKTDFDWSVHGRSRPPEIEESQHGQTNCEPVNKRHIVDETVHVGGREVDQREETL